MWHFDMYNNGIDLVKREKVMTREIDEGMMYQGLL